MSRLLLAGFKGSFMGRDLNPSGIIAEHFDGKEINGIRVKGVTLPITYDSYRVLFDNIDDFNPDFIICTGYRVGLPFISLERVALNYVVGPIPDNKGKRIDDVVINDDSSIMCYTRLPVVKIMNALKKEKIPAGISYDNGGYVCNYLFFKLLDYVKSKGKLLPAGFIHVPITPDLIKEDESLKGVPTMSQELLHKAFEIIIRTVVSDDGREVRQFIKRIENKVS